MTLDPSAVIDALEYLAEHRDVGVTFLGAGRDSIDTAAAAARSWVEGEEIGWCTVHAMMTREVPYCWMGLEDGETLACTIVSARICIDGGD